MLCPSADVIVRAKGEHVKRMFLATIAVALVVVACTSAAVDSIGGTSSLPASPSPTARPTSNATSELTATPSGTSPAPTPLPPGPAVQSAGLLDATDGWALTSTGLFLTADGGAIWRQASVPGPQTLIGVLGVAFADAQHGWLATLDSNDARSSVFDVWRTDDGARTWHKIVVPEGANRSDMFGPVEFSILSANHLFLLVEGGMPDGWTSDLYESTDGGRTWSADRITGDRGETGAFAFADSKHGVMAGGAPGNRLFATHDGGRSWQLIAIPVPAGFSAEYSQFCVAPTFWDAKSGALVVTYGTESGGVYELGLLVTGDAGASWSLAATVPLTPAQGNVGAVAFMGPADWAMAGPDTMARTADAGRTWTSTASTGLPGAPGAPLMSDAEHGWVLVPMSVCLGFKTDCSSRTGLYATVDGGATWTALWPK